MAGAATPGVESAASGSRGGRSDAPRACSQDQESQQALATDEGRELDGAPLPEAARREGMLRGNSPAAADPLGDPEHRTAPTQQPGVG
eukprot:8756119-Alexandrium_andersonii.AAC.1